MKIYGLDIDEAGRCRHYHSDLDVVALKCYACQGFYACYQCHDALETHTFAGYPRDLVADLPILCGACQQLMTISSYESSQACPNCQHPFNPGCKLHASVYFSD